MKRKFFVVFLVLALTSCANNRSFLRENSPQGTKILVVSSFPNTFYVDVIGTTIFTNKNNEFDDIGFNVNQVILNAFKNTPSEFDLVVYEGSEAFDFTGGHWYTGNGFTVNKYLSKLKSINQSVDADFVLLVGPERSEDTMFFTGIGFNNYGIARRFHFGSQRTAYYVSMKMALVDMRSEKIVSQRSRLLHEFLDWPKEGKLHEVEQSVFTDLTQGFEKLFKRTVNYLFLLI